MVLRVDHRPPLPCRFGKSLRMTATLRFLCFAAALALGAPQEATQEATQVRLGVRPECTIQQLPSSQDEIAFQYRVRTSAQTGSGRIMVRSGGIGSVVSFSTRLSGPGEALTGQSPLALGSEFEIARMGPNARTPFEEADARVTPSAGPPEPSCHRT